MRGVVRIAVAGWAVLLAASLAGELRRAPDRLAAAGLPVAARAGLESGDPRWHAMLAGLRIAADGAAVVILVDGGAGRERFLSYRAAYELYPGPVWVLGTGALPPAAGGAVALDAGTAGWMAARGARWVAAWRDADPDRPRLFRVETIRATTVRLRPAGWPAQRLPSGTVSPWTYVGMSGVLLLAGWIFVRSVTAGRRPPLTAWDLAGIALASLAFLLALIRAMSPQSAWMNWDAWMVWDFKVKAVLREGWLPSTFLRDPGYRFGHPEYPLGWPWLLAAVSRCAGTFDVRLLRLCSPPWTLALVPLLAALAGELGVTGGRWLVAGLVASLPLAVEHAANGYADWPLAVVLTGAQVALLRARRGAGTGAVAGTWAGAAAWIKQEGLVAGAACVAALAWSARGDRMRRREALAATAVWAALALPVLGIRWWIGIGNADYDPVTAATLLAAPARLPVIGRALVLETLGSGRVGSTWVGHQLGAWLWFWPAVCLAVATGWRALVVPGRREIALVVVAQAAAATAAYLLTNWDVAALLGTSLDRLLLQSAPALAALAAATGAFAPVIEAGVRPAGGRRAGAGSAAAATSASPRRSGSRRPA